MREDIKELWVTALRSGEYKQGTGQLNYSGHFCCLGVLCEVLLNNEEVASLNDNLRKREHNFYGMSIRAHNYGYRGYNSSTTLSPYLIRELSMDETIIQRLVDKNDIEHKSFEEIADWIEEVL